MHHTRDLCFLIAHKERKLSRNVNCRKGFDVRLCASLLEGLSSLAVHVNVVDVNRRDDNFIGSQIIEPNSDLGIMQWSNVPSCGIHPHDYAPA
jgi:hypothetical protein